MSQEECEPVPSFTSAAADIKDGAPTVAAGRRKRILERGPAASGHRG